MVEVKSSHLKELQFMMSLDLHLLPLEYPDGLLKILLCFFVFTPPDIQIRQVHIGFRVLNRNYPFEVL